MTANQLFTRYRWYRHLRHSAIRTLVSAGCDVRTAYRMTKEQMPYLFNSRALCDWEDAGKLLPI